MGYCRRPVTELAVDVQANFIQHNGYTIVYRRYASLFFIVGIDSSQVCTTTGGGSCCCCALTGLLK